MSDNPFLDEVVAQAKPAWDRLELSLRTNDPISAWVKRENAAGTSPPSVAMALIASLSTYLTALIATGYPAEEGQDLSKLDIIDSMGTTLAFFIKDGLRTIQAHEQQACDLATKMLQGVVERHGKLH